MGLITMQRTRYKTNLQEKDLINIFVKRGIITIGDVMGATEASIMKKMIDKIHQYAISKTTDGRFVTMVKDDSRSGGRRQIRRKTEKDMYLFLAEFYGVGDPQKSVMTIEVLYKEWVEYKRQFVDAKNRKKALSPSTIRRYERDYDNYIAKTRLAKEPVTRINPINLTNYLLALIKDNHLKEKNASNIIGYISMMFEYAYRSQYIKNNPAALLDRDMLLSMCCNTEPKEDKDRVLTANEMALLRAAVLEHEKKYPHYMPSYAIELAMLTGMRVGEIAALSWSAIDEKYICVTQAERRLDYSDRTSEIIIGKPKNGKIRRIPLTPEMKELFQKIRALGHPDREGFVFTEESGKRCKAHNISCAIARRCVDAGIEGKPIHGVRRTVSSMLRKILPASTVANMLGHLEATNDQFYNYDYTDDLEKLRGLESVTGLYIKRAETGISGTASIKSA